MGFLPGDSSLVSPLPLLFSSLHSIAHTAVAPTLKTLCFTAMIMTSLDNVALNPSGQLS